jgi:hypothetical protein
MTLTDTGPLVAILDATDVAHKKCVAAAASLPPGPFVTTWPCLTESMHFAYRAARYDGQAKVWALMQSGRLLLHDLGVDDLPRMATLMAKYRDTPMDLADASLIVAAEKLGLKRIFTLDGDFRVFRLADGSALEVVPN